MLPAPATELEFAGHATHALAFAAPTALLYVLTPHSVQKLAPAPENVPAPQNAHELRGSAPVSAENFPAPHSKQALAVDAPAAAVYRPTPQSAQTLAAEAPVVDEYLPATQSVHAAVPVTALYLPAKHELHAPPSGPVYPVLQIQLVTTEEPMGERESAGHKTHVLSDVLPAPVEYFPALQYVQNVEPVLSA
jgi:hypothetical protein